MQEVYDAYSDKKKNPEHWVKRTILRKILEMDKSKDKFNKFINEIEGLDDSYLYIQGTLKSNKTFNKVRIYNYINQKNREKERQNAQKKNKER